MDLTRDQRETSSHGPRPDEQTRWRTVRRYLNRNRYRLAQVAAGLYPEARRVGPTALLTRDQWLPNGPVALDRIELVLSPEVVVASISGRERESSRVRPVQANGERFPSYAEALAALDPPGMFENRPCYRLLDLGWNDSDRGQMRFGRGTYFDGVNTCEAVAHELADAMWTPAIRRSHQGWKPCRSAH